MALTSRRQCRARVQILVHICGRARVQIHICGRASVQIHICGREWVQIHIYLPSVVAPHVKGRPSYFFCVDSMYVKIERFNFAEILSLYNRNFTHVTLQVSFQSPHIHRSARGILHTVYTATVCLTTEISFL